jgi:2-polyprenyl-3-methyl-5-hydroxy-6-metoxy-1,4-benzoquinol methylase
MVNQSHEDGPLADDAIEVAVANLLRELASNKWFVDVCWPENRARALEMISDVLVRKRAAAPRLLDVGCFNGWLSYLFSQLGYRVSATDGDAPENAKALFARESIDFFPSNLNEITALSKLETESFDVVIMGEVIEHVLNHPLGVMREVARVLRPQGSLVLTTPNPATAIGAWRLIWDRASLWGTQAFMSELKIDGNRVISQADIHYREYRDVEVRWLLQNAGFKVEKARFMPIGSSNAQPWIKRFVKGTPLVRALTSTRLFGSTQYYVAAKKS